MALDLGSDTGTLEIGDSAFCSPHVPMLIENGTPKEQFAVSLSFSKCVYTIMCIVGNYAGCCSQINSPRKGITYLNMNR